MTVRLERLAYTSKQTLGRLILPEVGVFCKTLELPWRGNRTGVSCIPPAPHDDPVEYRLRHRSPAESRSFQYPHFEVVGVPGRSYILIHRGNYVSQIEGCILVGQSFTDINRDGLLDVTNSRDTLHALRAAIPAEATLFISYVMETADTLPPDPLPVNTTSFLEESAA